MVVVTVLSNIYKCDTHWHYNLICDSGGGSAGLSSDAHYVSVKTAPGTVYIGTVDMLSTSLVPQASFVVARKKGTTFKQHCSVCEAGNDVHKNKVTNSVHCLPALQRLSHFSENIIMPVNGCYKHLLQLCYTVDRHQTHCHFLSISAS